MTARLNDVGQTFSVDMTGDVWELALLARRAIEPGLQTDERGRVVSAGACLHAAVLIAEMAQRFGKGRAVIRGGCGDGETGAIDRNGNWRGHYWVELDNGGEVLVVDITGDQFGQEAVRVLPKHEAEMQFRCGEQEEVDLAAEVLRAELGIA